MKKDAEEYVRHCSMNADNEDFTMKDFRGYYRLK